ncbi:lysosomal-trafficking regulator isoform X1 [Vespula pensylvanica]|uniref:lysosomal-trafficking regulator isoform X1 n=1 Tax=Vespula pensylvanica TaxID=30213 RepID=UPI001CB9E0B3|nr:lysosomal-trafficking regulator isoform X1 [Vespula pensylvanica]XP_043669061.1 lysosomal-trafficking regulator isoform X1 [Vespula pensylvanica]
MSIFSPYGLQRGRGRSIHGRQRNEFSSTRSRRQKNGQSYISNADKKDATFYSMGVDVDRFETAAQEEILEEDPNLQEFAACDSYDVSSFEDDGRLKTVESEGEDDDEHHHEPLGMSSGSSDKLQILWDHFIHAEPLSYEKSSWLDIFLAELLAQVKEGRDVKDAVSFCSVGGGGVSTLVACELLSDVHELCAKKSEGGELVGLRRYLARDRGWRCLAVLHLLGVRGLSCGRELVALLVALYPVALQEDNSSDKSKESSIRNPYVKFYCNDDAVDTVIIVPHAKRRNIKSINRTVKNYEGNARTSRKKNSNRKQGIGIRMASYNNKQKSLGTETKRNAAKSESSESEFLTDGIDQARSLTLKIRLNPMDFEYFTSVVRSDEEQKWQAALYELPARPTKKIPLDYVDERIKEVLNATINNFETSLLIIQLLQGLRDYDTPAEQTPAVQVLKFALDTLWSLQFGIDGTGFTRIECATLKAAAARLMLMALERVLRADEPTTAVIHNGLLPMTLRLLEDACTKSIGSDLSPDEGSLLQEFIFATMYGIITFLYCLLHQRSANADNLSDFFELFRLFAESQDGKLIEKTILAIVSLPSADPTRSVVRAKKVIDMIGALMSGLKRVRRDIAHMSLCHRTKHKFCVDNVQSHHHSDVLGLPYTESIVGVSILEQACCVSSLVMTLTNLLKESHAYVAELRIRLLKVTTAAGICCCFSPKILLSSIVTFLKKRDPSTYSPAVILLERTLFKELGAYPVNNNCESCNRPPNYSWEFLEMYKELLTPDDPKLSYVVIAHLLKVTPTSKFQVRQELLVRVFYPTFLKAKTYYNNDKECVAAKFLILSCLSLMSNLIGNMQMWEKFIEMDGLKEVLVLLPDVAFTRSVYILLEVAVIMEIWNSNCHEADTLGETEEIALKSLFKFLENETSDLLNILEELEKKQLKESPKKSWQNENAYGPTKVNIESEEIEIILPSENDTLEVLKTDNQSCINENVQSELKNNSEIINVLETLDVASIATGKEINLHKASAVWRATAGVALCSPNFRLELSSHPIANEALKLFRSLAINVATDNIHDTNKSAYKLFEALITCCLTCSLCGCDVAMELKKVLIETGVRLGHGIATIIEALLKVSMLKPAHEQTIPQQPRARLPTMNLDTLPDCGAEDSSTGEYVTADDGYEADIEVPGKSCHSNVTKKNSSIGPVVEPRGHANAHPALCSLAIDLLIHFTKQELDAERRSIVTNGLRKLAITCRESVSSCAALAGSGVITKMLNGFKDIFTSNDPQYQDLQHAALEVFTLLATQAISSTELDTYLSFFKVKKPPMSLLLEPLYHLVMAARPQPNFILSFPVECDTQKILTFQPDENKTLEKADNLVNNFKKKHLSMSICSPWSVHATCLPVGPELTWSVWLLGCSASMWLRVERGFPFNNRGTVMSTAPLLNTNSESLSDWGILSDNWSREGRKTFDLFLGTPAVAGSSSPPTPVSIIHLMSIGMEYLVLEIWLDFRSDKLILRLTRPDDKTNRTVSETSISGILPSGRWHHLAINFKDTILNKRSAVIDVVIWIDGWKEINAQLPFDGILVRKPGTACILLGQIGSSSIGAWYLGNLMVFRYPVFTKERALYLASLGPNFTNLADCILNMAKPDFAPLITSGALNDVREVKFEGGKFDTSRRKSYGGTYLRRAVETKVLENKIDWESVMDATNSQLGELQDALLLTYEAQNPNIVHLYPQAIANPAVVRNLFPSHPGFRVVSAPEHKVSQQPPLSIAPILTTSLECQQYRGLIPAASLMGGVPIFLFLFARVVELNSTEEEQALAFSIVLHLTRSDSELLNQYRAEGGTSLLLRVLESPHCHAGRHMLKAMLDAACDSSILIKDIGSGNPSISQNCEAVITDPELVKGALTAWRTWAKSDTLNLLLQAILLLLRDQHSQREFNAFQLNRVGIVDTILMLCKEHFMYEDLGAMLESSIGNAVVELIRALMGAPPEFEHLVAITDYLVLVHQASETYITHSRHNIYFLLPPLTEGKVNIRKYLTVTNSSSEESIGILENSKLNKALTNVQIQKSKTIKRKERRNDQSKDTSAGEDSGIAASDGSNLQTNERQSTYIDERKACQGLVCEGLLLLLRDAVRVLPDSQVSPVLKHVLRAEVLLVLANNPDARVRTALIKVIQTYLQRANDEEVNKFIKQKYFMHLANQISLYPGSESLINALENLALRGPTLAAMPPLIAMIAKTAAIESNIAHPIISFITDIIGKNSNALRMVLEQGLIECLVQALVATAHRSNSTSLNHDIHVLLVAIAAKLLESPGNHQMQAVLELHLILNHMELKEMSECNKCTMCIPAIRDAQVALFDGELDALTAKISTHSGFRLRSTASYLASASYLTTVLTTSSEQSDHGSRSSSYGSLHGTSVSVVRETGKGELYDRFRMVLTRAVEFVTAAAESPSGNELQLTRRLFSILLHGLCDPLERRNHWSSAWFTRPALRKYTAKLMVWLLGPHQSNNTRIYAVRSLMEEPKAHEILLSLLEVHPQVEQRFTVFFWDLLQRDEMSSADARMCAEFREALRIWDLAKGIEQASPGIWNEELALLRRELMRDRDIWIDANLPAIYRISNRFDGLAKQLTDSAMTITRTVVEEQNRERKVLMERLKHARAMEAQTVEKWRDLAKRLTHERALWHFPESYPCSWELDPTEGPARVRIRLQRCHLDIDERFFLAEHKDKLGVSKIEAPLSYLFSMSRQDINASTLIERLHTSERIRKMSQAKVVTPRAELSGEVLIGETCLYFVPDNPDVPLHTDIALGGLDLAMAGGTAWRLDDIRELHKRRYQLQERAIEIFLITGRTYLLAFNSSKERDEFATELSTCNLPRRIPGDDLGEVIALWRSGALTNWEYITCLNKLAGRSYNDLMQYPVFPFVLSDYINDKIDLNNPKIYRNFKRPMAVQDKKNEQHYINNYNYLKQALSEGLNLIALNQEPFHYGSHYSNSGTVLHFLVRLPPFTSMFLCYQDDNFDIPDRTFHALATTWRLTSCDSTTDVKELIPEFFYLPEFLLNSEGFNFGVRQNGNRVGDVELPKWCGGDARLFILAHRAALETDLVREVLPYWIDLVFGFRQTGRPAVEAINVFHPATYYGFNVEQIADPLERQAWETMVRTYGQTPAQLFRTSHPLPIQNLGTVVTSALIPQVIEGVEGIKWGNYVAAPGNEPVLCWKHKHRTSLSYLIPLATGDVFGLPNYTTLLIGYAKEKGTSMFSGMSVLGAALASWGGNDGIARLKCKKEQPPKPLMRSSGLDPITILASAPDCGELWTGYLSGKITVHTYNIGTSGKIEFSSIPASVLLAHRSRVTTISLSRAFSIAVSGDGNGVIVIWDLNSLSYIRSIVCDYKYSIHLLSISETLGDIAVTYEIFNKADKKDLAVQSELRVYTINARSVGSVLSKSRITALCYSNAPEGVSVNVIATGLDNGVIRLWSSWDLRLVREIVNTAKGCGAIIAIAWALDQHHLYAATEDSTVLIWEGSKRLSNGTPKFVNLTSL